MPRIMDMITIKAAIQRKDGKEITEQQGNDIYKDFIAVLDKHSLGEGFRMNEVIAEEEKAMNSQRDILKRFAEDGTDWVVDIVLKLANSVIKIGQQGGAHSGVYEVNDNKKVYFNIL